MQSNSVCVVLSTFNGGRYLGQQLDSIMAQTHRSFSVLVRDDGSSDDTIDILREYCKSFPVMRYFVGKNVGVVKSYMRMLEHVPIDAQYVAFCDQDDVWSPEKLRRGVQKLQLIDSSIPALYCTRLDVTDSHLRHMYFSSLPRRGATFSGALVENVVTGCTLMINRAALTLMEIPTNLDSVVMHDWWTYLVVSAFGKVIFDEYASVKYRQHIANVVGSRRGFAIWKRRWDSFRHGSQRMIGIQTLEFMRIYGPILSDQNRKMVQNFVSGICSKNWSERARYAARTCVHRQTALGTFFMKVLITMGKYRVNTYGVG